MFISERRMAESNTGVRESNRRDSLFANDFSEFPHGGFGCPSATDNNARSFAGL
jgi:hypothetical protein